MQTAYKNVYLVSKETGKHPWFPGPLLVHRSKTQEEFQYFWQAVKRQTSMLKNLCIFGTDEEATVYNGILSQCDSETVHLLGLEHVKANAEQKLDKLKFPNASKRHIISDIFGGAFVDNNGSLYECETEEDFLDKVSKLTHYRPPLVREHGFALRFLAGQYIRFIPPFNSDKIDIFI